MRFGLLTPVVFRPPGQANPWEEHGDAADIVAVARAADRLGFHHLTCSEHVVVRRFSSPTRWTCPALPAAGSGTPNPGRCG